MTRCTPPILLPLTYRPPPNLICAPATSSDSGIRVRSKSVMVGIMATVACAITEVLNSNTEIVISEIAIGAQLVGWVFLAVFLPLFAIPESLFGINTQREAKTKPTHVNMPAVV